MASMRLDKWLWAARLYRTRSLAKQAIDAGHVRDGHGERLKPAHALAVGDSLRVTRGRLRMEIVVEALHERRRAAALASGMYRETADSLTRRALARAQAEQAPKKRPDKNDRRRLADVKRRGLPR
jgi:ribosome-associated heat shock protein Hsp15